MNKAVAHSTSCQREYQQVFFFPSTPLTCENVYLEQLNQRIKSEDCGYQFEKRKFGLNSYVPDFARHNNLDFSMLTNVKHPDQYPYNVPTWSNTINHVATPAHDLHEPALILSVRFFFPCLEYIRVTVTVVLLLLGFNNVAVKAPVCGNEFFLKFGFDLKTGGKERESLSTQRHLVVVKIAFSNRESVGHQPIF